MDPGYEEGEPSTDPNLNEFANNNNAEDDANNPQTVEFEDEDAYLDQDPTEAIVEFADHPMMDRVQTALYEQLKKTRDRVVTELLDREEALRKVKGKREEVGVQLYGMQQQLASLQLTLEQTQQKFNTISENKGDDEDAISELKQKFLAEKAAVDEIHKQVIKNQSECDALNETIRQVKQYNEEMKGEIAVTRRATYKAEENVKDLEKNKASQDLFIDNLNERIKKLQSEISLSEAQLAAQETQTNEAKAMLSETGAEMELISFEKKQLMQQWKSSIIALKRRDEALSAATTALKDAQTSTKDYDTEIDGLKREILKAQTINETCISVKDRLESESKYVDESIAAMKAEREAIQARYAMLKRSLESTNAEEKVVVVKANTIASEIKIVKHNVEMATRERHALEEQIGINRADQLTSSKATKNLAKTEKLIIQKVHEKEIEVSNINNELARIKVDSLNTEAHNVQLRDKLDQCKQELVDKDKLIEKYQMEIRQRNDEIEKKMYRVDRLNRKYEKMMEGVEDEEAMGPLEASIKNINKEIDKEDVECERLQREWLRDQTLLVQIASETDVVNDESNELRAKSNIMNQKRVRLLKDIHSNEAELKALKSNIQVMHSDMSRLNDLIGRNGKLHDELVNENFVMEREFKQELKEMEREAIAKESNIASTKAEKNQILDEIVEAERQIMLWEKKIQLAKETQVTLDPTSSSNEAQGMEREINRMKHRLISIKREQEKMIKEMEVAIAKREDISVKHRNGMRESAGSKKTEEIHTQASLKRKVGTIKKQLKQSAREAQHYTEAAQEREGQLAQLTAELEKKMSEYASHEEAAKSLQEGINQKLYEKQKQQALLDRKQKMIQRFIDFEAERIEPVNVDEQRFEIEKRLMIANGNNKKVLSIVNSLQKKFPHLEQVLGRVSGLAADE